MSEKQKKMPASKKAYNEKCLSAVFTLLKQKDALTLADKKSRFNDTELRVLGEILEEKQKGNRLISTQIATRLGITRSAVSQIVNRLEGMGVLKRVADEVDKKIAYIEIAEDSIGDYQTDVKACGEFIGRVVRRFGDDKFNEMCGLVDEFMKIIEEEKILSNASTRRYTKRK